MGETVREDAAVLQQVSGESRQGGVFRGGGKGGGGVEARGSGCLLKAYG